MREEHNGRGRQTGRIGIGRRGDRSPLQRIEVRDDRAAHLFRPAHRDIRCMRCIGDGRVRSQMRPRRGRGDCSRLNSSRTAHGRCLLITSHDGLRNKLRDRGIERRRTRALKAHIVGHGRLRHCAERNGATGGGGHGRQSARCRRCGRRRLSHRDFRVGRHARRGRRCCSGCRCRSRRGGVCNGHRCRSGRHRFARRRCIGGNGRQCSGHARNGCRSLRRRCLLRRRCAEISRALTRYGGRRRRVCRGGGLVVGARRLIA